MNQGITPSTPQDLAELREQLGREPRGVFGIAARCACGAPLVVATAPRLENGSPFPTTFYLTHPAVVAECSRLEAGGEMYRMFEKLEASSDLASAYRAAHEDYLGRRRQIGEAAGSGEVPEIEGISAGGMPARVKCLHALVGHALAAGPGVNPFGDEALALMEWDPARCRCVGHVAAADEAPGQ